jgi:hypothetical protein
LILSIKVSDEAYEQYGRENTKNPREAIEKVIERYAGIGNAKMILLTGEPLAAIQRLVGQIDEPQQLALKVAKVASVKIGSLSFPLTESQLKGIADKAAFYHKSPEAFATEQIQKALQNTLGV